MLARQPAAMLEVGATASLAVLGDGHDVGILTTAGNGEPTATEGLHFVAALEGEPDALYRSVLGQGWRECARLLYYHQGASWWSGLGVFHHRRGRFYVYRYSINFVFDAQQFHG